MGEEAEKKYEELVKSNNENHIFAIESDSGGFSIESDETNFNTILSWKSLFEPYLIHSFVKGFSGSDIGHLSAKNIVKVGLNPDSQRYFDYHDAANDKFDAVNKRELELGVATMAALMYMMDQK